MLYIQSGLVNYIDFGCMHLLHMYAYRCLSSYRQLAVASKKTHDLPHFQLYLSVWVSLNMYCSMTVCFSSKQLKLFGSLVNVMGEYFFILC